MCHVSSCVPPVVLRKVVADETLEEKPIWVCREVALLRVLWSVDGPSLVSFGDMRDSSDDDSLWNGSDDYRNHRDACDEEEEDDDDDDDESYVPRGRRSRNTDDESDDEVLFGGLERLRRGHDLSRSPSPESLTVASTPVVDGPYDDGAMLRDVADVLHGQGGAHDGWRGSGLSGWEFRAATPPPPRDDGELFGRVWRVLLRHGWWTRAGVGLIEAIFLKPGAETRAPHRRDVDYFTSPAELVRGLRAAAAAAAAAAATTTGDGAPAQAEDSNAASAGSEPVLPSGVGGDAIPPYSAMIMGGARLPNRPANKRHRCEPDDDRPDWSDFKDDDDRGDRDRGDRDNAARDSDDDLEEAFEEASSAHVAIHSLSTGARLTPPPLPPATAVPLRVYGRGGGCARARGEWLAGYEAGPPTKATKTTPAFVPPAAIGARR